MTFPQFEKMKKSAIFIMVIHIMNSCKVSNSSFLFEQDIFYFRKSVSRKNYGRELGESQPTKIKELLK